MSTLVDHWRRLTGSVHPDDAPLFGSRPHSFNLDWPPPAYIGDVDNAPVVLLMMNGGYNPDMTPREFADAGAVGRYLDRARGGQPTSLVLREALDALDGADEWPSDEAFRRNWVGRQFYGYFKRDRVLMILQALEHRYQSRNGKAEPLMSFDWSQLQIEHILPQAWETHWPLPEGLTAEERRANIQGIGNLTLVSNKLNPSLSNAPWFDSDAGRPGKRSGLNANTMLMINRKLLDDCKSGWSDDAIDARAERLALDAKEIWPR